MRRTAWLFLSVLMAGCGDSTSPDGIAVQFVAVPTPGGSFSLNLDGRTYTSSSLQTAVLSPGTYTVTGTVSGTVANGSQLIVGFSGGGTTFGKGGVRNGSIASVSGPLITTSGCGIGYFVQAAGPFQYEFRLTVTPDPPDAC